MVYTCINCFLGKYRNIHLMHYQFILRLLKPVRKLPEFFSSFFLSALSESKFEMIQSTNKNKANILVKTQLFHFLFRLLIPLVLHMSPILKGYVRDTVVRGLLLQAWEYVVCESHWFSTSAAQADFSTSVDPQPMLWGQGALQIRQH